MEIRILVWLSESLRNTIRMPNPVALTDVRSSLNFGANDINDTRNVMTMNRVLHAEFD